jgi:hypothetical protein
MGRWVGVPDILDLVYKERGASSSPVASSMMIDDKLVRRVVCENGLCCYHA